MLPVRQLILLFFLFNSVAGLWAQQTPGAKADPVTTRVRILEEKYCQADADVFTVSLKLEIEVVNSSKAPVYLLWPMVPWVGKVALGVAEAQSGHFLYQQTASHYPLSAAHFERLKIEPGKSVKVQSGYDLIARHDPALSLANSVSAGTYAVVLVLNPEEEPPTQMQGPGTLKSITTEPFVVEVPTHPKLVSCEAGAKNQ